MRRAKSNFLSIPIINNSPGSSVQTGVSDSTLQQVLSLKTVELSERLMSKYRYGCVICGLVNGKVVYEAKIHPPVQIFADWDHARIESPAGDTNKAYLVLPGFGYEFPGPGVDRGWGNTVHWEVNLKPGSPPTRLINPIGDEFEIYSEVLDAEKRVFLFGFQ
jgi:hypothetical protein